MKYQFYSIMTGFISYLGRQAKLIADMDTIFPRVVNGWLSTSKVKNWFKLHRVELKAHIKSKNLQSASFPSELWWV